MWRQLLTRLRLLLSLALLLISTGLVQAFIDATLIDNCNRTENPLSNGGQWSAPVLTTNLSALEADGIECNRTATAGDGTAWWNTAFAADQRITATAASATNTIRLYVRLVDPNVASATDGYACVFSGATPLIELRRYNDSSLSAALASTGAFDVNNNHKIGCQVTGVGATVTVEAWVDIGSGWVQALTFGDTSGSRITAATGFVGIFSNGSSPSLDDIGACAISADVCVSASTSRAIMVD
jgi:hypothetical protein